MKRQAILPIFIILAYAAAICLNVSFRYRLLAQEKKADIIQKMFGGLRTAVGDWAFMKAEEYHHRGLPFEEALAFHRGESILAERAMREGQGKTDTESGGPAKITSNLYANLYSQVKVTGDSHLKPADEKEVLPWFYVEVAFNPHDVRGYILGAYWLERVGNKNACVKFLNEGGKNQYPEYLSSIHKSPIYSLRPFMGLGMSFSSKNSPLPVTIFGVKNTIVSVRTTSSEVF